MTSLEDLVGKDFGRGDSTKCDKNSTKNKQQKKEDGGVEDEKPKREFTSFKYSNRGKGDLHEAIMLAGVPVFVKYVDDETETSRIN